MFWAIRRTLLGLVAAAFGFCLLFIYQHRAWFAPLADLKYIYENREAEKPKVGNWAGKVVRVLDGKTFEIASGGPVRLRIGFTGLETPIATPFSSPADRQAALDSSNYLSQILLSNQISAALTFSQPPSGIGIVSLGGTNLNAALLEQGRARLNRKFIRTLPVSEQYELIRAERAARAHRRGLWNSTEVSLSQ